MDMPDDVLDITPDPKVLLALTQTPLRPLDAICELLDNGLDSFYAARLAGVPTDHPVVQLQVPGEAEVRRGDGRVRVVDNGPGLDREGLSNAIRAGYSGKNRYDTLGLFGMGFNIATGKLGMRTTVTTAQRGDASALRVVIDLPALVANRKFEVPVEVIEKPEGLVSGTIIEISEWWPDGNANSGFVLQLARTPKARLMESIGRRYATLLRRGEQDRVKIVMNGQQVEPFEHCVWDQRRFVERTGWGSIPARIALDRVIHTQRRCVIDGTLIDQPLEECLECGGTEFRTIEERIRGWVGIQRFDDADKFGIDLIRNGRAIRVDEKDGFFSYTDEFGSPTREYPTDQLYGRIVGEVHLDHVPVDFQKQDFQRSSPEWQRALGELRGGSLLPSKWPQGERNETPVSKLFQGYRKVRNFGKQDMYMGFFNEATGKAGRIGRDIEQSYYQKFIAREPGYYDDARWWDLVEGATTPPARPLTACPECGFQNLATDEQCDECGHILIGKPCISCHEAIIASATTCPACGESQVPEVLEPWRCEVCGETNGVEDETCARCGSLRGTPNPVSEVSLTAVGELLSDLSFEELTFPLADRRRSNPLSLMTFQVPSGFLRPDWDRPPVPTVAFKPNVGSIRVFIDPTHESFTRLGASLEGALAAEVAQYLLSLHGDLAGRPAHSVVNIAAQVLLDAWGESLSRHADGLRESVAALFMRIADLLDGSDQAVDFFDELTTEEQGVLAEHLIGLGELGRLDEFKSTGRYLRFVPATALSRLFRREPEVWFTTVWNEDLPPLSDVGRSAIEDAIARKIRIYDRCLDECADFASRPSDESDIVQLAEASLSFLEERIQ